MLKPRPDEGAGPKPRVRGSTAMFLTGMFSITRRHDHGEDLFDYGRSRPGIIAVDFATGYIDTTQRAEIQLMQAGSRKKT